MKTRNMVSPVLRFVTVVGVLGVLLSGVTFAALQSPPLLLAGNSITTATADLRISKDGTTFSTGPVTGFSFSNVVPGGAGVPAGGDIFYLKNYGANNLIPKMAISSAVSNSSNVNLAKVYFTVSRVDMGVTASFSLKALTDAYSTGGLGLGDTIAAGATAQYSLKISMDADAFSGSNATISNIDLTITGSS